MKKKVLFISHTFERGGSVLLLKDVVQNLIGNNYDCHVWTPYEGELKKDFEQLDIPVYIKDFEVDRINRESSYEFDNAARKKIIKLLQKCKKNKEKLAIRCGGNITKKLLEEFDFSGIDLVGIFDNNPALKEIKGYKVYPISEIKNFNINIILIAHTHPEFLKKELKNSQSADKIKIIHNIFTDSKIKKLQKNILYFKNFLKVVCFFTKINPDIIFINNARNFWAAIAGKIIGKKIIWNIHESFEPKTFKVFPQFLYFLSFKFADLFIFPSKATGELYKEFAPKHKSKIIHCGVNIDRIENFKLTDLQADTEKELNIPENHKIICNIGTVEERKGQLYFAKAGINLLKSFSNITFVIVGSKNDEYSKKIESLIEESGFKNNFRIISIVENAYKYFNMADIYVCSSVVEAFPIVILEAMAFKKVIIATDIFGIPEAISHNETGILIPTDNIEQHIEKNIKYLIETPDLMLKLSENAHKKVIRNFTLEKTLNNYIQAFKILSGFVVHPPLTPTTREGN
ncbi:MAG: glycosyltransferase [bacterium]